MPSITPSVGAKLGKSAKRVPNESSSSPPASAMPALTSVSSIAAAERKTSVSTMIATASPISSPTGAWVCSAWSTIWPLRSVSMPARWVISDAVASALPGSAPRSIAGWSYCTVVNAMRPSGETWPSSFNGSARGGHVRLPGDRLDRVGDRGGPVAVAQRPVLDREHDGRRVPGLGGEPLGEQVVRALGLGAGRVEVVGEAAAGRREPAETGEDDEHDRRGSASSGVRRRRRGARGGGPCPQVRHSRCNNATTAILRLMRQAPDERLRFRTWERASDSANGRSSAPAS